MDSVVVAHGLSCSLACGIFPDPGSNLVSPASAGGFVIALDHQGNPSFNLYNSPLRKGF